jgi:hypothetical protein
MRTGYIRSTPKCLRHIRGLELYVTACVTRCVGMLNADLFFSLPFLAIRREFRQQTSSCHCRRLHVEKQRQIEIQSSKIPQRRFRDVLVTKDPSAIEACFVWSEDDAM